MVVQIPISWFKQFEIMALPAPREGDPLDSYYGYVFDGVIRNQQELDDYKKLGGVPSDIRIGDARLKDLNGDGKNQFVW